MKTISTTALPAVSPDNPLHGINEVIRQMAEELETLGGLRELAKGQSVVTRSQLIELGVLGEDQHGNLYKVEATQ